MSDTSSFRFFDNAQCEANIVLHVIQFLNARDSGRLMQTTKRFYYLVHQFRRLRGPELVAAASLPRSESAVATLGLSSPARNTARQRAAAAERSTREVYYASLYEKMT